MRSADFFLLTQPFSRLNWSTLLYLSTRNKTNDEFERGRRLKKWLLSRAIGLKFNWIACFCFLRLSEWAKWRSYSLEATSIATASPKITTMMIIMLAPWTSALDHWRRWPLMMDRIAINGFVVEYDILGSIARSSRPLRKRVNNLFCNCRQSLSHLDFSIKTTKHFKATCSYYIPKPILWWKP